MKFSIVLVFVMLVSMNFVAFAQNYAVEYKIVNNEIVINVGGSEIKYELGTKTAEYVMGYLANSTHYTCVNKIDVTYNSRRYTTVQFSNIHITGPDYKIVFLRDMITGEDVIKLYEPRGNVNTFIIKNNAHPDDVQKVDYVVGQIIKWMTTYHYDNLNPTQEYCIRNITVNTDGIPTDIEFDGFNCP